MTLVPRWLNRCLAGAALVAALATVSIAADTKADAKKKKKDAPKEAPAEVEKPATPEPAVSKKPSTDALNGITPQTKKINELLAKAWEANSVKPSPRSTDNEFIRRVFLDILGRIATPDEVGAFERDGAPGDMTKRARLVSRLLWETEKNTKAVPPSKKGAIKVEKLPYAEQYAHNWSHIWTVWLLTRTGNPFNHEQLRVWLEDQFADGVSYRAMVEQLLTAKGKTNDNGAVNYILAHLGERLPPNKADEEGHFEAVPITSRTTRLFLGLQTQCVQCHDHPFNPDWKQSNFWGVNVFFRQVDRKGTPLMRNNVRNNTAPDLFELVDKSDNNKDGLVYYEKRNGVILPTQMVFLDGRRPEATENYTRREKLATLVTTHEGFSKAITNRLWGHLFGRGMNEQPTVDDFGDHNKVVHQELLDYLGAEFVGAEGQYDLKKLLYWITTSDAYSLSSVANATNAKPETDVYFSRMQLKSMSPEQLFESLMQATLSDANPDERKRQREDWMKKLAANFGDDEGNEVTFNGTVVQALLMMNGKEINEALKKGRVAEAMRTSGGRMNGTVNELFLAALNRKPTDREMADVARISKKYGAPNDKFYADIFWALLNSNEFILNH